MVDLLLGLILGIIAYAIVIWIVGKLGLGMEVSGFGGAIVAAIAIGIVTAVIMFFVNLFGLTPGGGFLGAIVSLVIAAIILMIADRFVSGLRVKGFGGAIIAAIAIAVVTWIINWVVSLF